MTGGGGLVVWGPGQPRLTHQRIHIRKTFLRQKKLLKAGNLTPIVGTQTFFWLLTLPPQGGDDFAH